MMLVRVSDEASNVAFADDGVPQDKELVSKKFTTLYEATLREKCVLDVVLSTQQVQVLTF